MNSDWKSAFYTYMEQTNKMEIRFDAALLMPVMQNEAYAEAQHHRLNRLKLWYSNRQSRPLKQETRVKINHVTQRDQQVTIYISQHKIIHYDCCSLEHKEERIETQRILLKHFGDQWYVTRIEHEVPEKQGMLRQPLTPQDFPQTEKFASPNPYLNQEVFARTGNWGRGAYNRAAVQQYADKWWNSANPQYFQFEVDCTNFISQCIFAGGAPMNYTGRRDKGWWYKGFIQHKEMWSYSWSVANSLRLYLGSSTSGLRAKQVSSPLQLALGDVIIYDWDGDGNFTHSTVVTAFDAMGMPLVNAHTNNSIHLYWDYQDSYAWSPRTQYRFFHIADYF